ncbi:acyl-CoA thioesterase [Flagellimonas sediminis]|uniref:Acyl-CoA thioesterase n=1 Tax=Flagellimonas sediminis TaxID=2696468 RepID=A0A6I5L0I5_9FLAO|nr:acyl-CoA thioesterase [Allomuricauda sediminis]NDV44082.1 acyl-CoA thioesterase [Allomuricauda sediminis]
MRVYSEVFEVELDDLDDLNHVNNVRYVEWVQAVSKKHWEKVTTKDIRKDLIWVVRNHNISYHKSALLGDAILINTYIETNQGPISTRIVEIMKKDTNELLVKSITEWCLLDAGTFRPKRVPEVVKSLFI